MTTRLRISALVLVALVTVVLVAISVSAADPAQPRSSEEIDLSTTTLTGEELAQVAGIEAVEWDPSACEVWVERTDGDALGYCVPYGMTESDAITWRVARLLQGHVPSDAEMAQNAAGSP